MERIPDAPETDHPEPKPSGKKLFATLGSVPRIFAKTWRGLIIADILFKVFGTLLTMAFVSIVVSQVMDQTGRSAVTNTDLATFLLSPMGLLLAFLGGAGTLFLVCVEHGALMTVAAVLYYHPKTTAWRLVLMAAAATQRIARLAGLLVLVAAAIALPPVAASALLYKLVLGGHDINYYLSTRPPAFLAVAGGVALLLLAALAALAVFYARSLLALPILIAERVLPVVAIRESYARTRGVAWRVVAPLAVWHGGWALLSWMGLTGYSALIHLGFATVESTVGALLASASAVVGLALIATALSFCAWAGHSLLVLLLYLRLHPNWTRPEPVPELLGPEERDTKRAWRAALAGILLLAAVLAVAAILSTKLSRLGHVQITAHRGYSKVAPENTLSAVRKAIEAGANWAEIDVQETADGVVVVTHDRDLMRMAGDPRRLTEITFEELRAVDVGSPFSPEFAGERVPTLEEVISLSRGKIKLNIELKYYGDDPRLARDVARILGKSGFEKECFVASLNFPQLLEVKRENPALRTGAIVTAGVGDVTGLDAEVLSVGAGQVDFWFMRSARRAGKEVHVWTVDDERVAKVLMGRGVANIITNDPARMVRARAVWERLSPAEKLLLASRYILGLGEGKETDAVAPQGEL